MCHILDIPYKTREGMRRKKLSEIEIPNNGKEIEVNLCKLDTLGEDEKRSKEPMYYEFILENDAEFILKDDNKVLFLTDMEAGARTQEEPTTNVRIKIKGSIVNKRYWVLMTPKGSETSRKLFYKQTK